MLPFGIGFSEILVVLLVLIVFVGPEGIPQAVRAITKVIRAIRSMVDEVKYSAEFDEVKREILQPLEEARRFNPRKQAEAWVKQELEHPLKELSKEHVADFESALSTHPEDSHHSKTDEFSDHSPSLKSETIVSKDEDSQVDEDDEDDQVDEDEDSPQAITTTDPLERSLYRSNHIHSPSKLSSKSSEVDPSQEEFIREDHCE